MTPMVPAADLTAFEQAMRQAGADWQMVFFGGAVHGFTNPAAGDNKASGAAYDARAARRVLAVYAGILPGNLAGPRPGLKPGLGAGAEQAINAACPMTTALAL